MDLNKTVRLQPDYLLERIDNEITVYHPTLTTSFFLNETGALIWALCDGTANSPGPDLRDRFIVGALAVVVAIPGGLAAKQCRRALQRLQVLDRDGQVADFVLRRVAELVARLRGHRGLRRGLCLGLACRACRQAAREQQGQGDAG